MLAKALREHASKQQAQRAQVEKLRKDALVSVGSVTDAMTDLLNQRVREIFNNQRLLEAEAKHLQALSSRYSKQTSQWLAMIETFNNSLKVRCVVVLLSLFLVFGIGTG